MRLPKTFSKAFWTVSQVGVIGMMPLHLFFGKITSHDESINIAVEFQASDLDEITEEEVAEAVRALKRS